AYNCEDHVVGLVGHLVIGVDVIARQSLDDRLVADDRDACRADAIAVHVGHLKEWTLRLAFAHLQLALNDFSLALEFSFGDLRAQHPAGDQIHRLGHVGLGGVDEKLGVIWIGGCVGVVADLLKKVAILGLGAPFAAATGDE